MRTRREFVKLAAAGLASVSSVKAFSASGESQAKSPQGELRIRSTFGNLRFADRGTVAWQNRTGRADISFVEDRTYQSILGFGGALTDAACYNLWRLPQAEQAELLKEFFDAGGMGLNVGRVCIGSSDYSARLYSYDEGEPDPELKRFSIAHDRDYILPVLRASRDINPGLFLLASPWSPPGWMKANNSMLGGSMRKSSYAVYADYLGKFLQSYADEKVPIQAITSQNEVDTDQDGRMPACFWGQEYEVEFIKGHLGPKLAKVSPNTKIWILDHNYNLCGRAMCELEDAQLNPFVDGVAWHGYAGDPAMMTRVHDAFRDKHAYWTEGGPDFTERDYLNGWAKWSETFTGILRNWARCVIVWNLALDEKGQPNIGPFQCGGLVSIDSKTREVTRSGQYWALAHFSKAILRDAARCETTGNVHDLAHVGFVNPGGEKVLVVTNRGAVRKVRLQSGQQSVDVELPADSVSTLTWA